MHRGLRVVEDVDPYRLVHRFTTNRGLRAIREWPLRVCENPIVGANLPMAFPKEGKGDRRRRWMRMSAVALRESALASACVWVCAFPLSIADMDCPGGQSLPVGAPIYNKSRILLSRLFRFAQNPPSLTREGLLTLLLLSIDGNEIFEESLKFYRTFRSLLEARITVVPPQGGEGGAVGDR